MTILEMPPDKPPRQIYCGDETGKKTKKEPCKLSFYRA